MRAAFEHIEVTRELSWKWFVRRDTQFAFAWHFHREFELTLITKGSGTRLVGDAIEEYGSGDLTLIGPELPHTYTSTAGRDGQEAVVAQFRRDFLGVGFFDRPEFARVAALLDRSARGLSFPTDVHLAALPELGRLPPAERTLGLLNALVLLSHSDGARQLASEHHNPGLDRVARERIDTVVELLHAEHAEPISLKTVADKVHMAPAALSRFFRRTTGTTITGYLNTLRVNAACRILVDTDLPIAHVAAGCGYQNLSHFNRRFRILKGVSPREYRAGFRAQSRRR
jgi:AraC-like DNA-binding protein